VKHKDKYILKDIKKKFEYVRAGNDITNREYTLFCKTIEGFPNEMIEFAKDYVYFALLSADKKTTACFVNKRDIRNKNGVVVLSALFFCNLKDRKKFFSIKECSKENRDIDIAHEIAHCYKNHIDPPNIETRHRKEKEADEQACRWLAQKWFPENGNQG
jgi:hypothetical protein